MRWASKAGVLGARVSAQGGASSPRRVLDSMGMKGRVSITPCAFLSRGLLYRHSNKGTLHAAQEERESKRAEGHGAHSATCR